MENIIKKAMSVGWKQGEWVPNWAMGEELKINFHSAILDPLFWQALGKASKWDDANVIESGELQHPQFHRHYRYVTPLWKFRALMFYEINLNEGWDKAVEHLGYLI